jgi:hypothetical protein
VFDDIEEFCKAHEHTISAIEAISTLSAVIVSLVLAHRATIADRTRLVAQLQISTIFHPTISPKPRFVVVTITNTGNLPLQVPLGFFRWKVPFRGRQWLIMPIDFEGILGVVPQKTYPVEIKPRSSETFFMSEALAFLGQINGIREEQNFVGLFLFFLKNRSSAAPMGRRSVRKAIGA